MVNFKKESYAVAAVKAFVERDGKILIIKESPNYKGGSHHNRYVMPGGKVNEGEHFLDALKREVHEECGGLEIGIGNPFHVDEWRPMITGKPKHIVGIYFRCPYSGGEVALNDEFQSYKWIKPEEYDKYDLNDAARRAFKSYLEILPE